MRNGSPSALEERAEHAGLQHVAFERPRPRRTVADFRAHAVDGCLRQGARPSRAAAARKRPSIGVFSTCRHSWTMMSDCTNLRSASAHRRARGPASGSAGSRRRCRARTRRASVVAPEVHRVDVGAGDQHVGLVDARVAQDVLGVVAVQQPLLAVVVSSRGSNARHSMPSRSSIAAIARPKRPKPTSTQRPRGTAERRARRAGRRGQPLLDLQDRRRAQADADVDGERLERIDDLRRRRTTRG